jgi:hypothetical protein
VIRVDLQVDCKAEFTQATGHGPAIVGRIAKRGCGIVAVTDDQRETIVGWSSLGGQENTALSGGHLWEGKHEHGNEAL